MDQPHCPHYWLATIRQYSLGLFVLENCVLELAKEPQGIRDVGGWIGFTGTKWLQSFHLEDWCSTSLTLDHSTKDVWKIPGEMRKGQIGGTMAVPHQQGPILMSKVTINVVPSVFEFPSQVPPHLLLWWERIGILKCRIPTSNKNQYHWGLHRPSQSLQGSSQNIRNLSFLQYGTWSLHSRYSKWITQTLEVNGGNLANHTFPSVDTYTLLEI